MKAGIWEEYFIYDKNRWGLVVSADYAILFTKWAATVVVCKHCHEKYAKDITKAATEWEIKRGASRSTSGMSKNFDRHHPDLAR